MTINGKQVGSFEVVRYNYNSEGNIQIEMIKVLDTEGNYIKFAKLGKVINYLSIYPVSFKSKCNE